MLQHYKARKAVPGELPERAKIAPCSAAYQYLGVCGFELSLVARQALTCRVLVDILDTGLAAATRQAEAYCGTDCSNRGVPPTVGSGRYRPAQVAALPPPAPPFTHPRTCHTSPLTCTSSTRRQAAPAGNCSFTTREKKKLFFRSSQPDQALDLSPSVAMQLVVPKQWGEQGGKKPAEGRGWIPPSAQRGMTDTEGVTQFQLQREQ